MYCIHLDIGAGEPTKEKRIYGHSRKENGQIGLWGMKVWINNKTTNNELENL